MCRLAIIGLNHITSNLSNRLLDFTLGEEDISLYEAQMEIDINNRVFEIIDRNCSKVSSRMERAVSDLASNMRKLTKDWEDTINRGQKDFEESGI